MKNNLKTFPDLSKKRANNHAEHFGNLIVYASEIYEWKQYFEAELLRILNRKQHIGICSYIRKNEQAWYLIKEILGE